MYGSNLLRTRVEVTEGVLIVGWNKPWNTNQCTQNKPWHQNSLPRTNFPTKICLSRTNLSIKFIEENFTYWCWWNGVGGMVLVQCSFWNPCHLFIIYFVKTECILMWNAETCNLHYIFFLKKALTGATISWSNFSFSFHRATKLKNAKLAHIRRLELTIP